MRLILGSQSPRRKEILSHFNLPFEQFTSDFIEESVLFKGDPGAYAQAISDGKSETLRPLFPDAVIITADTVVYSQGKTYGKPRDEEESFSFLQELAGQWQSVYTAVTVRHNQKTFQGIEETRVLLNDMTAEEIRLYQNRLHLFDKAAGYAVQLPGGIAVNRIEGCFFNVMGLPLNTLRRLLKHLDINLWEYMQTKNGDLI
jgi:septum formation protein